VIWKLVCANAWGINTNDSKKENVFFFKPIMIAQWLY